MSFIDSSLPTQIEQGAVRTENAAVDIVGTDGGFEVRNIRHSQPLFTYEVDFGPYAYDDAITQGLYDLWQASAGGAYAFKFRDWDSKNNSFAAEEIGTGDDSTTEFQIKKTWTVGGVSGSRKITRPVDPVSVFIDGALQASGFTVDYGTGIVTFSSAPTAGQVITVTGEFDIPVRFDRGIVAQGLHAHLEQFGTIVLVEVKE